MGRAGGSFSSPGAALGLEEIKGVDLVRVAAPRSRVLIGAAMFFAGLATGAFLFTDVKPRSILAVRHCDHCLDANELTGLAASVGLQKFLPAMPLVVMETDKTVVFQHPRPAEKYHYLIVPKKDIKSIGDLSEEDKEYLIDMFAAADALIRDKGLRKYRLWTNGPGRQAVGYLHIHLSGK
jgi:histidine triad (HIT) family protein